MKDSLISIVPICYYFNVDTQKRQIYKDNRKKSGIYRWNNIISGKSYIGSSVDLSNRFRAYFSINNLIKNIKRNKSKIYSALLKYGYNNFNLEIIEYCDISILIEREQWYLDNLKPEYNILKIAGSRLGTKQSEKTKKLISNASRIHRHSEETKEKIRVANTGRKHTEATKLKMSANRLSHTLRVINNKTGEIKIFTSIRLTAEILGIHRPSLIICLRKNKIYIGKGFTITRV